MTLDLLSYLRVVVEKVLQTKPVTSHETCRTVFCTLSSFTLCITIMTMAKLGVCTLYMSEISTCLTSECIIEGIC